MSVGWKFWIVGLVILVAFLLLMAQRDVDELRNAQRRIAVLEQMCK